MKRLFMAACFATLAACGADSDEREVVQKYREEMEAANASLIYSFPANGQEQVPTPSPVVLRFSSAVTDTAPDIRVRKKGGADLAIARIETPDSGRSMVLYPDGDLDPLTEYEVVIPAINLQKGTTEARTISFRTGALAEGAASQVGESTFRLVRTIPDNQGFDIVTDMSTFRVQFSQPLDRSSIDYGNTVKLATSAGVTVPAHVLVSGSYLTVDPKADLNPSQQYTLTVTSGVRSASGDPLPSDYTLSFTPADTTSPTTGERSLLIQDVADAGTSPLTGAPINLIPMASVLLGQDTATQSRGVIGAELAYAPNFPEITPLRIPRGMLLRGEAIDVLIGGSVDAGPTLPDSGEVTITFLSDATGYMIENPYSNSESAPRLIHLYMDVGVSTDRPAANGAITQTIQHIELVGTAFYEGDALEVNAVGMVEPLVLGSESAQGLLAFYMKAFDNQDTAPPVEQDVAALELQSWSIDSTNAHLAGPGDPIIANFNKPIDPESVEGNVSVTVGGVATAAEVVVDGAAIVIRPSTKVNYSPENSRRVYEVTLAGAIADVSGNTLGSNVVNQFELPIIVENITIERSIKSGVPANPNIDQHIQTVPAPVVLATYPGYPCVFDESTVDIESGIAGRCAGGHPGTPDAAETDYPIDHHPIEPGDDLLPITRLPANRPIAIAFSKEMDADSVVVNETFVVEKRLEDGVTWELVYGRAHVDGRQLLFYPDDPWQEGELYRYTIVSAGYRLYDSSAGFASFFPLDDYSCDGASGIHVVCSTDGLPVQTQVMGPNEILEYWALRDDNSGSLDTGVTPAHGSEVEGYEDWYRTWGVRRGGNTPDAGGPPMVQYFFGDVSTNSVLQALRAAPTADVNANFYHERSFEYNLVDFVPMLGAGVEGGKYVFAEDAQEYGPSTEPHVHSFSDYDPNGVLPGPNMAKVLSVPVVPSSELPPYLVSGIDNPMAADYPLLTDLNVGCGFGGDFDPRNTEHGICPENKFTTLTSALFAEVTDEKNLNGDVKVKIWPGVIMGSNINLVGVFLLSPGDPMYELFTMDVRQGGSGPLVMRMRYAEDEHGNRTQPIEAWIAQTPQGPVLRATVDLYLDTPSAMRLGMGYAVYHTTHTGYPITMELEGPVRFLSDGRMVVEQWNANPVVTELEVSGQAGIFVGKFDVVIPERGSYLQYISEPIK